MTELCEFNRDKKDEEVRDYFKGKLNHRREPDFIDRELKRRFPLSKERQVFKKRVRRKGCPKNPRLSNTRKRKLGLYDISKKGLLYKDLVPLHQLWIKYMEKYLNLDNLKRSSETPNEEISQMLWKADYTGAYLKVTKSSCHSLVGIEGIIVFETRNMIKLLGKDDITRGVPKNNCEFKLKIANCELQFLGKNFLVKSTERSVKKLRAVKFTAL